MSKNVNVFIGVLLCAVLCGTFVWLSSSGDESSWSPGDIYNEVQGAGSVGGYATTSATFSGPSNEGGVALPMSSSSMRARSSYKYAGAYSGAAAMPLTSNLSPLTYGAASGAGMHLTSSAEIKSFGGGGNGGAAMGGAMSNGRFNSGLSNPSLQGGAGVGISPIAYSTARRGGMSSVAGDDLAMMAAETPVMAMTNAASVGMGNGFYGAYSVMDYSSASYAEYTGMFGGGNRMGIRGRQNLDNVEDTWLNWLALNGSSYGTYDESTQTWYLDVTALRSAWEAFCSTWNEGMGKKPTWDEWLAWFQGSEGNPYEWNDGSNPLYYTYLPVGNILPLLCFAMIYVVILFVKRNKTVQL